ncbi:S8 family serine peptidase [Streptomyces sp. NPDC004609]|uniref:S8 family serine peptidase n=1 Tax=Streptomyces sp. NPDC004609 TaxID=3364704 RepID=UPI00367EB485
MVRRLSGRRPARAALATAALAFTLAVGAAPPPALPAPASPAAPGPGAAPVSGPAAPYRAKTETGVRSRLDAGDRATFWVTLSGEADTSAARRLRGKAAKGRAVHAIKRDHARKSQAPLLNLLKAGGARYESFWITNTVKVTAGKALAEKIAARPEVTALEADDPVRFTPPRPEPGQRIRTRAAAEWNVGRVNAPEVWSGYGVRGEGITVASVDTGVDYTHPALRAQYRGLRADGTYDHDYNWFDPYRRCVPEDAPCDYSGHGTLTAGIMVGDDGADNRTGVAPGARWIAVGACGTLVCYQDTMLSIGQWILAPTDRAGRNPRPDLAPDVVNSSWTNHVYDSWYKPVVQAWRDAGIFPAFHSGNTGPACVTAASPGSYDNAHSTGSFDFHNTIAGSSGRGTGEAGRIKPDLAAPGVDIRSTWRGGTYKAFTSPSLASPHTAAAVALLWSAVPAMRGDIAATERALGASAADTGDLSCGGTIDRNNVFGEGRLDAFAAVTAAARGPVGTARGTVTAGGAPVPDATVTFTGPVTATVSTRADGRYDVIRIVAGEYRVTAEKFGHTTVTGTVTVPENADAVRDFALTELPSADVTGRITALGGAEANTAVHVPGTPLRTTTAADGRYRLRLPLGRYDLAATPAHRCAAPTAVRIEVTADSVQNIALPDRTDTFGTVCAVRAGEELPRGTTKLPMNTWGGAVVTFDLPFPIPFYGRTYRQATANLRGAVSFASSSGSGENWPLPDPSGPSGALLPFWDELTLDDGSGVYWTTRGTAPHRELVVEWRNVLRARGPERLTFSAVAGEDGTASFHYRDIDDGLYERGVSATVGIENDRADDALMYSYNEAVIHDGMSIHFRTTKTAVLSGTVTDANDGGPVAGARATVGGGAGALGADVTGADGGYAVQVPSAGPAAYDIDLSAPAYTGATARRTTGPGGTAVADAVLATGRVAADTRALTVVVPAGQHRTRTLTLSNTGSASPYTVAEKDAGSWITASPAAGELAPGQRRAVTLDIDTTGVRPGSVLSGTLRITSRSGRAPVTDLPVTVVVPAYQKAVDAGAARPLTDPSGDTWTPDVPYTPGGHGHLGRSTAQSTSRPVAGVPPMAAPALYSTARQGMYGYRFDGLPAGTYRVELGFAELASKRPGARVFGVTAQGREAVPDLDLTLEAGTRTAHDRAFTVQVTGDGRLDLRFPAKYGKPLVNSIRVTERPDLSG